jgi:hypothetical protein
MSSKPVDHKDPGRVQGATVLGPGDFPIGSMQSSRMANVRRFSPAAVFNLGSSDDGNAYGFIACLTVIVICYLKVLTACAHVAIIASVEATP